MFRFVDNVTYVFNNFCFSCEVVVVLYGNEIF